MILHYKSLEKAMLLEKKSHGRLLEISPNVTWRREGPGPQIIQKCHPLFKCPLVT